MTLTLVSFHADIGSSTFYAQQAEGMKRQCKRLGIECRIERLPSRGGWLRNTLCKASFIREKVREVGPVLWVDVDSEIKNNPMTIAARLLGEHDLAILTHTHHPGPLLPRPVVDEGHLYDMSLRMFDHLHGWSSSPQAMVILDRWVELCDRSLQSKGEVYSDHRCLQLAVDEAVLENRVSLGYFPHAMKLKRQSFVQWKGATNVPGRSAALHHVAKKEKERR